MDKKPDTFWNEIKGSVAVIVLLLTAVLCASIKTGKPQNYPVIDYKIIEDVLIEARVETSHNHIETMKFTPENIMYIGNVVDEPYVRSWKRGDHACLYLPDDEFVIYREKLLEVK